MGVGIADLTLTPEHGAGTFKLSRRSGALAPAQNEAVTADDVALVLHTSGTTSRPKIVPLSQRNVCTSARNIRATLALTDADRALNVMPLFHIHGLIAGLLAPLSAGGQVCCTPGFDALHFFRWMDEVHPTWYTAVPTMHQTILARAAKNQAVIRANPLRFVRSSSSALPTQVIREIEATFNAPLIESYGMTEAAHQMASNPLPPMVRKPGSVGIAAGPELAIMDQAGNLLPSGATGEIVIRGANVTRGYQNNPKANSQAFTHGWFRTGDQGVMDDEGYVTLTGRLKEIINRGGEKISPREVDEVLMDHPAVRQVVTFALPHEKLGEDVAAAVVLKEGITATEKEIRDFAGQRLAPFKVPRTVIFLDEIPKGATGKLQRIGLAQKLGLA
jgi:acyl-CoA synthetase (AMP-forming)/AMP-acid ligase II